MKSLYNFLNESKRLNDDADLFDVIDEFVSWNDEDVDKFIKDLHSTKSVYAALDKNNLWGAIKALLHGNDINASINSIKKLTKEHDRYLSDNFLTYDF